jgi:hypothetical protein
MESRNLKKQIVLALVPLGMLCVCVFSFDNKDFSAHLKYEEAGVVANSYSSQEQKQESPSHEPMFISVFKFIVNCNPFKREAQY